MIIKSWKPYLVKGAQTESLKCTNCNNTSDHVLLIIPKALSFGFVFAKKPMIGKRYVLACPICGNVAKVLTKEQAKAMKE